MIKHSIMFKNNKPGHGTKPIWRRRSPAIPVRDNLKTSYVQLSRMHGDRLPRLKQLDRPEYSHQVRHFENICETSMMRNVNVMYREHRHIMRKLTHGQDTAYKVMCRIQRDKRRVQRADCVRRQEVFREKMKSHRMRALILNVAQRFKDNVQIKKAQRALAQLKKEADENPKTEHSVDSLSPNQHNQSGLSKDQSSKDCETSHIESVQKGENEINMIKQNAAYGMLRERKGSLTRTGESIVPVVKTAENRERWDTDLNNNSQDIQEVELPDTVKKSRVLEVSKPVTQPVTKTKGNDWNILEKEHSNDTMDAKSENSVDSAVGEDRIESSEGTQIHGETHNTDTNPQNEDLSSRHRSSIFCDDQRPDYGWFTIGNPVVQGIPPSSTNDWSRKQTIDETLYEDSETDNVSLPPLRRRKAGVARPPSAYLKDQLEQFQQVDSNIQSSDFGDSRYSDLNSDFNGHTQENKDSDIYVPSTTRSLPVVQVSDSSQRMSSDVTNSFHGFSESEHLSSSCDPSTDSKQRSNIKSSKTLSVSNSKLLPVKTSLRPKNPQQAKDAHYSANMMWVLKQEAKSRQHWEKHMSEEEKILKYYKTRDGQFVATVTERKSFQPPSNKEKHRQQKLLVGEKVKDYDRRERIDEFYKTIPIGETPSEFIYEGNSPQPQKKLSQYKPPISKFGNLYDAFKDKDMINPVNPDSYDAMKGVAYLRVRDDGNERMNHVTFGTDEPKTSWNQP